MTPTTPFTGLSGALNRDCQEEVLKKLPFSTIASLASTSKDMKALVDGLWPKIAIEIGCCRPNDHTGFLAAVNSYVNATFSKLNSQLGKYSNSDIQAVITGAKTITNTLAVKQLLKKYESGMGFKDPATGRLFISAPLIRFNCDSDSE